jgi:hypothetical protein
VRGKRLSSAATNAPNGNHPVGAANRRLRHGNAQRLGALEVDEKFALDGLLDWEGGRLLAREDAAGAIFFILVHVSRRVCTENLNPDIVAMKPAKDRV